LQCARRSKNYRAILKAGEEAEKELRAELKVMKATENAAITAREGME
jgi:hypothetical protein